MIHHFRSKALTDETLKDFRTRLKRIEKNNNTVKPNWLTGRGAVAADGVLRPVAHKWVPWKLFIMIAGGVIAFKVFLLIHLGENVYHQKLSIVDDGTLLGEVGVRLMLLDPVTLKMRDYVVPIVEHIFIN